ncbi:MAG: DUF5916 domain-containing protein [Pyrinomonadaceae bacterium]
MKAFILILLFLISLSSMISAQGTADDPVEVSKNIPPKTDGKHRDPSPKTAPVNIPLVEAKPVIDGVLNDEVWRSAARFSDFVQTQPGDNIAPSSPVEAMMAYDKTTLYIAFRVTQDKDKIRATVSRRDEIFQDDYVGLFLDTFNDKQRAYALFFNPFGIQADGTYAEAGGEDYSVDIVMQSKGVLTDNGYTVEIAIPFQSLRYAIGKGKNWGLQLYRRAKWNNNELDSWMPDDRSVSGNLSKAGHITGIEDISEKRTLEISPTITLSQSGRRSRYSFNNDPAGRYVNDGVKADIGFTAKFGITPNTTLDFAYNPDFAQVEADAPVTSANQRFPIFYPEKRPFFLERIDMFQSPMDLVNTRSIVDPDIAAKLTGKTGKNTFGLIYASDKAPGNFSKDERESYKICSALHAGDPTRYCPAGRLIDRNADIGVVRYKRDIGRESNFGLFGTTYNFVDRHNHTGGFDGRLRFDKKTVFEFQAIGTHTRGFFYDPKTDRVDYRTGNGIGYSGWIERAGRNFYMNFVVQGRSSDYRADVGYTNRTDTNGAGLFMRYRTDPKPKATIVSKQIAFASNVDFDWKGRTQRRMSEIRASVNLQKNSNITLALQQGYERVFEHEFGPMRTPTRQGAFFGPNSERSAPMKAIQIRASSTPIKQLSFNLLFDNTWGTMDYDFGAGDFPRASIAAQLLGKNAPLYPGPGTALTISAFVQYRPTTALRTDFSFDKSRLRRYDTGLVAFDDNIFSSRTTYQFTRDIWVRARLDYSTLAKRFRPQIVMGWTPKPGTALYVGYSDDLSYNGRNPYTGQLEPGFHGNGRTFFIKASYLFKRSF